MTFQFRKVVGGLALSGALALPAMAGIIPDNTIVTAGDPNSPTFVAPTLSITIGGASATDAALGNLIRSLCVGNGTDLTKFRNGATGNNYQAYYCTLDAAQVTGLGANTPTLIRKRSKDGSGTGALPVCTATAQQFMKVSSNCTFSSATGTISTYNCTDSGAGLESIAQTDGGITDVGPNELFGLASGACDTVKKIYGADLSIIATKSLRDALQCAQGLPVGSELAKDMPQLSKSVIRSIQSGATGNWSQVKFKGVALTAVDFAACALPAAPTNTKTTYLRRESSSGTFSSNELRINNKDNGNGECGPGNFGSGTFPGSVATGPIIPPLMAGSGDIDAAMTLLNTNGAFASATCVGNAFDPSTPQPSWWTSTCPAYNAGITAVNANKSIWAISHQSTERNGNNGVEGNQGQYRTVAIDGVVPTLDNVANGKHDFWVESTGQYQSTFTGPLKEAVLNQLFTNASNSAEIAAANALNTNSKHAWGQGGIFAIKNTPGNCDSATFTATGNPCSALTRSRGGSTTPNCSNAVVFPGQNPTASPSP